MPLGRQRASRDLELSQQAGGPDGSQSAPSATGRPISSADATSVVPP